MFALGVWLILRYFGEEAPLMDLRRGAGALLLYLSLLVILQFFETFTAAYANVSLAEPVTLRIPLELTWTLKRAGGWLGAQLYLLLLTTVGELGALFVVAGAILLGARFATEVSTYEMAHWGIGIWRRGGGTTGHPPRGKASRPRRAPTRSRRARRPNRSDRSGAGRPPRTGSRFAGIARAAGHFSRAQTAANPRRAPGHNQPFPAKIHARPHASSDPKRRRFLISMAPAQLR